MPAPKAHYIISNQIPISYPKHEKNSLIVGYETKTVRGEDLHDVGFDTGIHPSAKTDAPIIFEHKQHAINYIKDIEKKQKSTVKEDTLPIISATAIYKVTLADPTQISKSVTTQQNHTPMANVIVHKVEELINGHQDRRPNYYPKTLRDSFSHGELFDNIRVLFSHYSKPPGGQFLSLHWNRHHNNTANLIVEKLPNDPEVAYQYLLTLRTQLLNTSKELKLDGDFMNGINFALYNLSESLELTLHNTNSIVFDHK